MVKVLLLPASLGDGHKQVASALREAFVERDVHVVEVDCFRGTSLRMSRCLEVSYEWITRYSSPVYGLGYRMTSNLRPHNSIWKAAALLSKPAVMRALERYHPDIVLQLFPDRSLATLLSRQKRPYIGVVLTDYSIHGHWFHDNVDTYFLAHENLRDYAQPFLTTKSEVVISGIPVRSQFYVEQTQHPVNNQPYILFATGGRGVFPQLRQTIAIAHRELSGYAVYVMCGRNEKMFNAMRELFNHTPNIHALPFVNNVASWLRGASFAVIKSGGVTVSECLATHCPMIIYHPQPGQETNNAAFMKSIGAAEVVQNLDDFRDALIKMKSSSQRMRMTSACASVARPEAAKRIVEHVLHRLNVR